MTHNQPKLVADIGGTFARFAVETGPGIFEHSASLRCVDYPGFAEAVSSYLQGLPLHLKDRISQAGIAIATPVAGDEVRMTNYHWRFSIEEVRSRLNFEHLVVVNDFTALAMALPSLRPQQRRQVGSGTPQTNSVIGLIGAGSGLGVSGLIPAKDGWVALGTEGGHTTFAPHDEREIDILRFAWREHSHVSFERLVSGPGLELIYRALAHRHGRAESPKSAPAITKAGLEESDALCRETMEVFCGMLGTAAANLAVTQGAFGGIYIGGGIVPKLGDFFDRSGFRARFEDKGRFGEYLKSIPTYVITSTEATLVGASIVLGNQLRSIGADGTSAVLGQIQRVLNSLSPAEQRVAQYILSHPRAVVNDAISTIAKAAAVSQPTVIRFCRSLGCEGLSDFKLRLASGLTGTMPITHTQVTADDSMVELGAKVLSNTASAILQERDKLNRESIQRAVDLICNARRVDIFAAGHYSVVADDAQLKFMRLGVNAHAYTSPRIQKLAAQLLEPQALAILISSDGRVPELLEVADTAHNRGCTVIALTASQSPLAKKADLTLVIDHGEDISTQLPMLSRILHLLMVDILVVGSAMKRGIQDGSPEGSIEAIAGETNEGRNNPSRRSGMGISSASALTEITSHSK